MNHVTIWKLFIKTNRCENSRPWCRLQLQKLINTSTRHIALYRLVCEPHIHISVPIVFVRSLLLVGGCYVVSYYFCIHALVRDVLRFSNALCQTCNHSGDWFPVKCTEIGKKLVLFHCKPSQFVQLDLLFH